MTFEMRPADHDLASPTQSFDIKRPSTSGFTHSESRSRRRHLFIPNRPTDSPDLTAIPVVNSAGRKIRKYALHPSNNRFFLRGRLLTGGDSPWAFIASVILVFGITGVYFGTTCVWWWKKESPTVAAIGAYVTLLTISSMMTTVGALLARVPKYADHVKGFHRSWNSPSRSGSRTSLS
jgi:palmitoyltransferase ZDHHC9/14/18